MEPTIVEALPPDEDVDADLERTCHLCAQPFEVSVLTLATVVVCPDCMAAHGPRRH